MKILSGLLAFLVLCNFSAAGEIDLSFNSDAVRAFYVHDFINNDLQADFGILTDSDKGEVFNVSLVLSGLASDGVNPLEAGVGVRSGYVDGDGSGQSGFPLAVGGFVKYIFDAANRVSLRADVWYAPDVLTLGDVDTYEDFSLRLGYNVLKSADVYIGARYVNADFDNNTDVTFDNGMNIGFNIRF